MTAFWILSMTFPSAAALEPHQATGVKVGEVAPDSAIIWVRLTAKSERNSHGVDRRGPRLDSRPATVPVDTLEGECPGMAGRVRVRYGPHESLDDAQETDWADVSAATDFAHQFRLTGLTPDTLYHYTTETAGPGGSPLHVPLRGRFRTAPRADDPAEVAFTVITGQAYKDLDHRDGYEIYESMAKLRPAFIVPTGDTVYYDNEEPVANTIELARYHWHRMYSLPRLVAFHLRVPGYWEKDDHDTYFNDCWPGLDRPEMCPLTFADGQRIFLEQVPMGERTYRTYRWGKLLQIWLVEGRDFRSPNTMPDGPDKTIWGRDQKQWLKRTLVASDADWKVLISPTPIVGPDRGSKQDNHANEAFTWEGDEIRNWAQRNLPDNFFVVCGDRHWQYHSVHPRTGLHEFACGPASDEHAGGSPGEQTDYHRFHRVRGGFLSVTVCPTENASTIAFRLHDVNGRVVYEYTRPDRRRPR